MSYTGSDGGGAMPPSRLLALLQGLQGAAPDPGVDLPPPSKRLGLFGGGYRAFMAGLGDGGGPPVLQAVGLGGPPRRQAMQLASNGACASCHTSAPPPPSPMPNVSLPELEPLPPLLPPGGWTSLLPPPLGGLVTAGRLAGILSGASEYRRSGSSPQSSRGPRRPKQCDVQHDLDEEICDSLPFDPPERRERCWRSQKERDAYCIKSRGEVGWPRLETE